MSNGPSSHPSTSTPHDIDVGGLSQPSSQTQAYDLTVRASPSAKTPDASSSQDFASRPSNSFKTASGLSHPVIFFRICAFLVILFLNLSDLPNSSVFF